MAQRAFLHHDDANETAGSDRLALTVCTQSGDCDTAFEQSAVALGLLPTPARLLRLSADSVGPLDDVLAIECGVPSSAEISALHRLDDAAARSATPTVVVTTPEALETVFACMERSRAHILVGATPAQRSLALSAAVSHVAGNSVREMDEEDRFALLRLTQEVERLAGWIGAPTQSKPSNTANEPSLAWQAAPVEQVAPSQPMRIVEDGGVPTPGQSTARTNKPPLPDPRLVARILKRRQLRHRYFEGDLFADPAWDMLLDLTAARAEHRRVSVTSLCIASGVPTTTALRWIAQMVDAKLFQRVRDDQDRRRVFIALTDTAAEGMARYFEAVQSEALLG